jgi:hypothetical protein
MCGPIGADPFCFCVQGSPFLVESLVLSLLDVEAESAALDLVRALYDLTDGLPQQWCMLEELRGRRTARRFTLSHEDG